MSWTPAKVAPPAGTDTDTPEPQDKSAAGTGTGANGSSYLPSTGSVGSGALFDAATIVEKLPPPPPLPRGVQIPLFGTRPWIPPESDLRLKDLTV